MKRDFLWHNSSRENINAPFTWPPMKGNIQFCYSADQTEITISHIEDKKMGITFASEISKRFDLFPDMLQALLRLKEFAERTEEPSIEKQIELDAFIEETIKKATEQS